MTKAVILIPTSAEANLAAALDALKQQALSYSMQ